MVSISEPDLLKEVTRSQDGDFVKAFKVQKMLVSGYDEIGLGGNGAFEHAVVRGVCCYMAEARQGRLSNNLPQLRKLADRIHDSGFPSRKLRIHNSLKLIDQDHGSEEFNPARQGVFENPRGFSSKAEARDQNVGVQYNAQRIHATLLVTNSTDGFLNVGRFEALALRLGTPKSENALPTPLTVNIHARGLPQELGPAASLIRSHLIDVLEELLGEGDINRGGLIHVIGLYRQYRQGLYACQ